MGREVGRKRPAESEVTDSIKAPDPLHRSGLSRAAAFQLGGKFKNQAADENDKKKREAAFRYPVTAEALDISDDI